MTPETNAKLTEAVIACEAEGCRVWGFLFEPSLGPIEPFSSFSGTPMSRATIIHNTELALSILKDHEIRSQETGLVQVYEA